MYTKTTRGITITVKSYYLDDQSVPAENHFVWAYKVKIENNSEETVQLLRRHWRITDARGHVQEVDGAGVVGEQPVIEPGKFFEYTSGTPLPTSSGIMDGSYQMETQAGESFDAQIPPFSLDSPHVPAFLN